MSVTCLPPLTSCSCLLHSECDPGGGGAVRWDAVHLEVSFKSRPSSESVHHTALTGSEVDEC